MKKQFYLILTLISIAILFAISGCKKDNAPTDNNLWGDTKQVDIAGRVLDESGNAVAGAIVKAGTTTATTDANGVFSITAASVYENLGYLNVVKSGYFMGSRSFVPRQGVNLVNIRLLTKNIIGSVSAVSGGTVQAEGVSIVFAGGSFVKGNTAYNGQVSVALNYINPEGQFFDEEMPGNLLGVQNGISSTLKSYGMVAIELTDGSGNEVKIASGSTATVIFPVPLTLQTSAPTEIDLWSFDESNGYWKHEGKAILQNATYVASVSHFSFWNCDLPSEQVMVSGRIIDAAGNGVQSARIKIWSSIYGNEIDYTSSTGHFGGYVPRLGNVTLTVEIPCGNTGYVTVYSNAISHSTALTILPPITITDSSFTLVSGNVTDCNNNPLTNGGYVATNGQVYFFSNGTFSFMACGSSLSITPYAYPDWTSGQTQNILLTGGTYNVGTIQACGASNNGTVHDVDGNIYDTVQIGNQTWLKENLKTTHYRDGTSIPYLMSDGLWVNATGGGYAIYGNDPANNDVYGKLYNFYAVTSPHNLCPVGWHVPTDAEFTELTDYLGIDADKKMKSINLWSPTSIGGDNSSGFTALPGGYRTDAGAEGGILNTAGFWTSTSYYNSVLAWSRLEIFVNQNPKPYRYGLSVRCVKD